ncbi:uncharacterized protein LOC134530858 isoform X2 [Bacillus rossius redtenbacheri]
MESSDEITVELMQEIMREVEKDNTLTVLPSLLVDELNKELHGGSCLSRVTVNFSRGEDKSQQTISLIVKVLPNIAVMSEAVRNSSMFPREIQMFDEILPRMSNLLKSALAGDHTEFFARVYYTRKSPNFLIAIEDLAPKGFKAQKRKYGLDLKHCQLAFKMIARFHAASVVINRRDKDLLAVFDKYSFTEEALKKPMTEIASRVWLALYKLVESWDDFGPSWSNRLRKCCEKMQENLLTLWTRDDAAFNVLDHGDFGVHNTMFRYSESGEVEAVMLVDIQCCSYNSPVLDLIQFLFSSASEEVKTNHIDVLLQEYHAELVSTLESLGATDLHIISLSQLVQEFESKMLMGLFYTVTFLPLLSLDSDSGFTAEDFFKIGTDAFDMSISLFPVNYVKALKRLLPIFGEKNLL